MAYGRRAVVSIPNNQDIYAYVVPGGADFRDERLDLRVVGPVVSRGYRLGRLTYSLLLSVRGL